MSEPLIRLKNLKTLEKKYNLELQTLKKELATLLDSQDFLNQEIQMLDNQVAAENKKAKAEQSIPYGYDIFLKHVNEKKEHYRNLLDELAEEIQMIEDKIHLVFQEMQKYKIMSDSALQEMNDHHTYHENLFLDEVSQRQIRDSDDSSH